MTFHGIALEDIKRGAVVAVEIDPITGRTTVRPFRVVFVVGDEIEADGTWSLAEPNPHRVHAIRADGWLRVTPDDEPPYFINPAVARKR